MKREKLTVKSVGVDSPMREQLIVRLSGYLYLAKNCPISLKKMNTLFSKRGSISGPFEMALNTLCLVYPFVSQTKQHALSKDVVGHIWARVNRVAGEKSMKPLNY